MRERTMEDTVASSDADQEDLLTGIPSLYVGGNPGYKSHVSAIADEVSKDKHSFKPCLHLLYDAAVSNFDNVDSGDMSNDPNPRTRYFNRRGFHYGQLLPPVFASAENYITVTGRSTDDIADCVFQAYNQYINGVRALDSSQSIAEVGEFPQLFNVWNRRRGVASNITNGFLNYSFGWKPVLNDLRAICDELRQFPKTVKERLRKIGDGKITRHFKYELDDTVDSYSQLFAEGQAAPHPWGRYHRSKRTRDKRRKVVVTIRASVKPKMTGQGQEILNKLGSLGLIPSLATLWAVTRLSFVVDWFYNIGGAIENLQGSLTHDISNVEICVTDLRTRVIEYLFEDTSGDPRVVGVEEQRYFRRQVPSNLPRFVPQLKVPHRPIQYVLLGFIALVSTRGGKKLLRTADRYEDALNKRLDKIERRINTRLGFSNRRVP